MFTYNFVQKLFNGTVNIFEFYWKSVIIPPSLSESVLEFPANSKLTNTTFTELPAILTGASVSSLMNEMFLVFSNIFKCRQQKLRKKGRKKRKRRYQL